jgi:hypothetical protein
MSDSQGRVDSIADFANSPDGARSRWIAEIDLATKEFEPYWKRCEEIERRYRMEDEQGETRDDQSLSLLWAQVQTEIPAIYQRRPQPQVSRRFKSKDVPARVASLMLERYLAVDLERDGIDGQAESMVRSYLLFGRAIVWVDNEPVIVADEGNERVVDMKAPITYLSPRDFLHSASPTWREVTWVARRHFFTRDKAEQTFADGMRRFGWTKEELSLDAQPTYGSEEQKRAAGDVFKRATIWEIWDSASGMVVFLSKSLPVLVDVRSQPLKLESRFPVPEPAYGTLTDGSLIPVPDYCQWQSLSEEIDELSTRIRYLSEACRVGGAYDQSNPALANILKATSENQLVPVENWKAFGEKGGLNGAISWLPVEEIATTLKIVSEQRDARLELLNQLSGFTDVMRGQGDPRTTATQDRIKSNYGSLRLQEKQSDFTRFMDRILRVKAEIIAELAPPEVLIMVSSVSELPEVAREQDGAGQLLMAAVGLLKDDKLRDFRLEVQERSMAAIDESEERGEASEFVGAMGELIGKAAGAPPEMLDMLGESALFVARRYRVGREMEGTLEFALEAMKQKAEQARAQPPQPPPEIQAETMRHQNAMQQQADKHDKEMTRIEAESQRTIALEQAQAASQRAIEEMKAQSKERVIQFEAKMDAWLSQQEARFEMMQKEREMEMELQFKRAEFAMESKLDAMRAQTEQFSAAQDAARQRPRKVTIDGEVFTIESFDDEPAASPQLQ